MSYLTMLWNSFIVFTIAFLLMKLMGKRAVAQMSAFDLLVVIILGTMFATPLNQNSIIDALIATVMLVAVYMLYSLLMLNNKARQLLHAEPTVLISKGNIHEKGLAKTRITVPELLSQLRIKGYSSVAEVEFAIMEPIGDLSVIPKSWAAPITPKDLHLPSHSQPMPVPVILAGAWVEENLIGQRDKKWVEARLRQQGIDPSDVSHLTVVQIESDGSLTIDAKNGPDQG